MQASLTKSVNGQEKMEQSLQKLNAGQRVQIWWRGLWSAAAAARVYGRGARSKESRRRHVTSYRRIHTNS